MGSLRGFSMLAVLAAALLPGCDPGAGTGPNGAATITAVSATAWSMLAGEYVDPPPTVRITDRRGQPVAGVDVAFTVTRGDGEVMVLLVASDSEGMASTLWRLGGVGPHTMEASVKGLIPVEFAATALPRLPTTIVAISPTAQTARPGEAVPDVPAVRVSDQTGHPLFGAEVVFTTVDGGGTVTGRTAVTDYDGIARAVAWTLGSTPGLNTLTASAGGLSPLQFVAAAAADPCMARVPLAPGATVTGRLLPTDCTAAGHHVDLYEQKLPSQSTAIYEMTSTEVDSWLEVYDWNGNIVAINDDADPQTQNALVRLFAPAGSYTLAATSYSPDEVGGYRLNSSLAAGITGCQMAWVVPGVTVQGTLGNADCTYGGFLTDDYLLVLRPGQTLTARLESTTFDAYLELYDSRLELIAVDDDGAGGTNALLAYTASEHAVFLLAARTASVGQLGQYSLTVTVAGGSSVDLVGADRAPKLGDVSGQVRAAAAALSAARAPAPRPAKAPR